MFAHSLPTIATKPLCVQNFINNHSPLYNLLLGTAPSCCSTPPPAFDDISEGSSIHRPHHQDERGSGDRRVYMSGSTSRSTAYRDDTVR